MDQGRFAFAGVTIWGLMVPGCCLFSYKELERNSTDMQA